MSETNAQGQSPLNEGTDRDREEPEAPNVNVDPDLDVVEDPQDEEVEDDSERTEEGHHDPMNEEDTASGGPADH